MRSARRFVICSVLAGICLVSASVIAWNGKDGWGWFLFVSILMMMGE